MERNDNESKQRIESTNTTKNMFSMVEQVNAGYGKYFDSKPKTSMPRSECYKSYIACGTTSQDQPKRCVPISDKESNSENGSHPTSNSHKNVIQEVTSS